MFPADMFASCAHAVPECNDTVAVGFSGDSHWIGLVVIATVALIIFVTVRLRGRRR
jgi:tetrahydromethanopterin S-methyltransferase subunit B